MISMLSKLALVETSAELLKRIWSNYINHEFKFGNFHISFAMLLQGIAVLVVAYVISRSLRGFLSRQFEHSRRLDPGLQYTVLRLTHYLIVAVGLLFALHLGFGADLTSFAVVFTALSVGIGFGLQYIAGDIASGFILLFERPVRVGDFVTVGVDSKTVEGKVKSINLRTTLVMTNDRIAVVVPNSQLVSHNLINWSQPDARSRISIPIGVASDSDPDLVTRTLLRAAEGVEYVLPEPKPSVQFTGFGDFTNDFRLLVWTDRPRRHQKIKSDINYQIARLFKEADIEIPNPQRDLHIRGGALRVVTDDARGSRDYEIEEREESFTPR
jgi:potassium efflux system protein